MNNVDQAIKESLQLGKDLIAQKVPTATGSTVRSLEVQGNKLMARPFFTTLSTGRGPSKKGSRGSKVLFNALKAWANARGIPERAVFPIARTIHKKGDQIHRGQKKGLSFTTETERVQQSLSEKLGFVYEKEVVSIFDNINT